MDGVSRGPAGKEASGADRSPVETRRGGPIRRAQWRGVLARLRQEWKRNKLSNAAAALTFYGVLAIFPFLLFIVALAGLVIQPAQVQTIIGALGREVPPAFSQLLYVQLAQLTSMPSSRLLTFSVLASVWSAAAGVVSLIEALNTAYGVTESRPRWKVYGIALGMMLAAAILAVLAGLITVAAPALAARFGPPRTTLVGWLRLPIAALLMMMLWATLYSVLPDARQRFKLITCAYPKFGRCGTGASRPRQDARHARGAQDGPSGILSCLTRPPVAPRALRDPRPGDGGERQAKLGALPRFIHTGQDVASSVEGGTDGERARPVEWRQPPGVPPSFSI